MYEIMPSNQFNQKLAAAGHSQQETNKLFDVLIYDALHQAMHPEQGGHGSCTRLSAIVSMCEHVRGINVRKVQAFIQAHADVRWTKNDNGTHSFEFRYKPAVTIPTITWYEWDHPSDKAKIDVDVVKEIKRLLNKAAKEGAVVKDKDGTLSDLKQFAIDHGIQWNAVPGKPASGKQKQTRESKAPSGKGATSKA